MAFFNQNLTFLYSKLLSTHVEFQMAQIILKKMITFSDNLFFYPARSGLSASFPLITESS